MLERHIARQGAPPRQTASDGGYASLDNLKQAKALGVEDVAFHKKRALTIDAMVKSRWVYRKLKNFRAGIEANISCLKRALVSRAALGAGSITSKPTSGHRSLPTTSPCSHASTRHSANNSSSSTAIARPIAIGFSARQTILLPLTATQTRDHCQTASQSPPRAVHSSEPIMPIQ